MVRAQVWNQFRFSTLTPYQPYAMPGLPLHPTLRAAWFLTVEEDGDWWGGIFHVAGFQCVDLSQVVPAIPLGGEGLSILLSSWYETSPPLGFRVRVAAMTANTFVYGSDALTVANDMYGGAGADKGVNIPTPQGGARLLLFPGLARRRYLLLGYFVDQAFGAWRESNPLPLQGGPAWGWFAAYESGRPLVRVMRL
jgi:hypothetical protein